ncbi:MAG TPA: UbiD family decarboxylase [Acidobacteriota bacterium]|nr:UbiD family decarboxylase [Acidobacteriota bacterium]
MAETYFTDFRSYLDQLEGRGKLHRWTRTVNKDTELMPLMRLQYRGIPDESRQAFLYENVVDSRGKKHDIRVATGVYGSSRQIAAFGLGCEEPLEIYEKWRQALANPIEPRRVAAAPVQEIVYTGDNLRTFGVSSLPAPVEEPGFSGGIRATGPFITVDPQTGVRNVGMYSGHFRGETKLIAGIAPVHHAMLYHHQSAVARHQSLPVAIVLGSLPDITFVSAANLPYGVDELAVAGGIRGRAVNVVQCKTIPLEVPAEAEIVIEGEITVDSKERGEPFSDYPGYLMVEREFRWVIEVKAITMRRNAIFTAILVGLPPSESNGISRTCREMMLYNFLRYNCAMPEVMEVACPEMGGGWNWWVIRMKKTHPSKPKQALRAASGMDPTNKMIIVVDEDIDPKDPDMVMWAMSFAMQPHLDVEINTGRSPLLDPSAHSLKRGYEERSFPGAVGCSGLLIDATRKGPFPPVGLPKKSYMENALRIWQECEMPKLNLKTPWHGYPLGLWDDEDDRLAEKVAQGEYFQAKQVKGR